MTDRTEVIFQLEGCPVSVNVSSDDFERTENGVIIRLTYWELWNLIRNLSDMKNEVKV